jgi:hypothetical protein
LSDQAHLGTDLRDLEPRSHPATGEPAGAEMVEVAAAGAAVVVDIFESSDPKAASCTKSAT